MIKNCEICNKEFKYSPSQNRKYCSPECSVKSRVSKKSAKRVEYNKTCLTCDEEFMVFGTEKSRKYCSPRCYSINMKNKKIENRRQLFVKFETLVSTVDVKDYNHYYVIELLGSYRVKLNRVIQEFSGLIWKDYLINKYGDEIKLKLAQFKSAETLFIKLDKTFRLNGRREKTFKNFKSNKNGIYRFDWYSKELNLIIEYDGSQHFCVDGYFNKDLGELVQRVQKDEIKKQYCIENDISLVKWPFNLKINSNNVNEITNSILANQQPSSEKLQYFEVSEKVQRLMSEDVTPINSSRAPGIQFINF